MEHKKETRKKENTGKTPGKVGKTPGKVGGSEGTYHRGTYHPGRNPIRPPTRAGLSSPRVVLLGLADLFTCKCQIGEV